MKFRNFLMFLCIAPILMSCTITLKKDVDLKEYFDLSGKEGVRITDSQEITDFAKKYFDGAKNTLEAKSYTANIQRDNLLGLRPDSVNRSRLAMNTMNGVLQKMLNSTVNPCIRYRMPIPLLRGLYSRQAKP